MKEEVILVDEHDNEIGTEEKLKAHRKGLLHRAFSIFIFNSKGQLLLQRRVENKYHSGGLWSNTCCSHPRPNEDLLEAAHRRLKEEMGFDTELEHKLKFIYRHEFDNNLTEHELDYIITGTYDGEISPDKEEVMDYRWIAIKDLEEDIQENPEKYSVWFPIALKKLTYF